MARVSPVLLVVLFAACSSCSGGLEQARASEPGQSEGTPKAEPVRGELRDAIFAGGCFWCMEGPFEKLDGVMSAVSGYTGGEVRSPTYEQVSHGGTGHAEAVRVVYDPSKIDYARLLEVFWHNIDPTQQDGQFCDHGSQYRSAIFVDGEKQRRLAKASKKRIADELGETVHTEIEPAGTFWVAEDYHQNYYRTHEARYKRYRRGCGRDARLRELWGEQAGH
jgi:peptide-methionine (S)-S-oxide reductase